MSAPVGFGDIPAELRALKQWVNWKIEQSDGRETKVPYQPSGVKASTTDPRTWSTFERVCKSNGDLAGNIGFVFKKENGYVAIDFDKCRNKETGETEKRANEAIRKLNSYTEVSQSSTGWHVIVKGALPAGGNRRGRIEMYETGRFFCMTGRIRPGCGAIKRRDLSVLHQRMLDGEFDSGDSAKRKSALVDESREDWRLIGKVYEESGATDADALEDAFREAHPERYRERNATKKRRGNLTYFRYTIENFIKVKAKQSSVLADGGKITDAGNATLLVEAHRDDLLYCFEMKKWLFWDGKRWQVDEKQRARVLMEETQRDRVAELVQSGATAKEITEASACLDTHRITNGLREVEKKLGIPAADLDKQKFLLTFDNGTLDLETMRLHEHKRLDFITKMVHCNYNPRAARPERITHPVASNYAELLISRLGT
jgi:putative DNA primase/helicase